MVPGINIDEIEDEDERAAALLPITVEYGLSNDSDTANGINDGLEKNNGTPCHLLRNGAVMALNIDAINFVYLDNDAEVIDTPVAEADLGRIRAIQVTLVARSGEFASAFLGRQVDTREYVNQQNETILPQQNDGFRRLMLSAEVKCRNLGL